MYALQEDGAAMMGFDIPSCAAFFFFLHPAECGGWAEVLPFHILICWIITVTDISGGTIIAIVSMDVVVVGELGASSFATVPEGSMTTHESIEYMVVVHMLCEAV